MAKQRVLYCEKCKEYTKQTHLGKKPKNRSEIVDDVILGTFSFGIGAIITMATDNRPDYWECTRCGNLNKN